MAHRIGSNGFDGHQGAARAKELQLQRKNLRDNVRAERKEGEKQGHGPNEIRDRHMPEHGGSSVRQTDDRRHLHVERGEELYRRYDRSEFSNHSRRNHVERHHGHHDHRNDFPDMYSNIHNGSFSFSYSSTMVVTRVGVFNGSFGSIEDALKAHSDFSKAALNFIKRPSEKSYSALNDAMKNLMDSRFTSSHVGGMAQISVISTNKMSMARFSMEVTPAPTKSLEEARAALQKNYNQDTYTDYIRALSEKFKSEGKIAHTNNTPTTPVFKSSIYVINVSKISLNNFREIKRPDFRHNHFRGRLFDKHHGISFSRDFGKHNSYMNMLRGHTEQSHFDHRGKVDGHKSGGHRIDGHRGWDHDAGNRKGNDHRADWHGRQDHGSGRRPIHSKAG